jgi:protein-tyrosine-phosphatase
MKKRVLFVCVENANRSQMSEAYARIYGNGIIDAFSAGSSPSGQINPAAINAMNEIGYDLSSHTSKSLDDVPQHTYDYVITMGCGDACDSIDTLNSEDWDLPDPKEMPSEGYKIVRNEIEQRVLQLIARLR